MTETESASESDILLAQRIISASARHDLAALRLLLESGSANVQDPTTGTTPLHAAIASCAAAPADTNRTNNGVAANAPAQSQAAAAAATEDEALRTVQLLLANGAIWNDLDANDETPGCVALRLGLARVYAEMVEAGVRAELLFSRMAALGVDDDDNADDDEAVASAGAEEGVEQGGDVDVSRDNHAYLESQLRFKPGILLDSSDNAVMMDWETEVMTRHAVTLLPTPGLRALNVGHGMGIVDRAIQDRKPREHHIVEAHPQVLAKMRAEGWMDKAGVRVWEGRWQDVLPRMADEGVELDAIYYDTFAEPYAALREFFSEHVVDLLHPVGRFGWYNGLGADRQICYDVYAKVAEMDLFEAGFDTVWEDIRVPEGLKGGKEWEGTRRPYWELDVYKLPVNEFSTKR